LAASPSKTEVETVALLHKARAVHAILASTVVDGSGNTLLEDVIAEADYFIRDPGALAKVADIYAVAAVGLLADGWDATKITLLGNAIAKECVRRRISYVLRGAGDAQRLCLAAALLGPAGSDESWLDQALPCQEGVELSLNGVNPFDAPAQLEALESASPECWAPSSIGAVSLLSLLSSKHQDTSPQPKDLAMMRHQLIAWRTQQKQLEVSAAFGRAWMRL
jgi:hypothetical protein